MSVSTQVLKVGNGFVGGPCVDDFSFIHECHVVKLAEDGVAWLVNGEDDSLPFFGEPEYKTTNDQSQSLHFIYIKIDKNRLYVTVLYI